jgi:hypothetical protein
MPYALISDATVRDGYVAAIERLHGAIDFKYRPMLPERTEWFTRDDFRKAPAKKMVEYQAAALQQQVVEWDVLDGEKSAAISVATIRRLDWGVLNSMFNIAAGFISPDPRPVDKPLPREEEDTYAQSLLESAERQEAPGATADRIDSGN